MSAQKYEQFDEEKLEETSQRQAFGKLSVSPEIISVAEKITHGLEIKTEDFFRGMAIIAEKFCPKNEALLEMRDKVQASLDGYLKTRRERGDFNPELFEIHARGVQYTEEPMSGEFKVNTQNVDREIASTAAPQLVCPIFTGNDPKDSARFPLNAANARWGSLYDALYGKPGDNNVIPEEDAKEFLDGYNAGRGAKVIAKANEFLDGIVAFQDNVKFSDIAILEVRDADSGGKKLVGIIHRQEEEPREVELADPSLFVGYTGVDKDPKSIFLKHNGLHIELQIDRTHQVGSQHGAGVKDVILESAVTTIMDLEDSACVVDAQDKALAYHNVGGLLRGDLEAQVRGKARRLNHDKSFISADGITEETLPGRSLMLFRSVGLALKTDAITFDGKPIPETLMDVMMIALSSRYDLQKDAQQERNSREGSAYIVMPKMHGPKEVAHVVELFGEVEEALGLPPKTLKIGIMDEEQRMSVNLREAVRAASDRVCFINTGFLDRTGDLIHSAMELGPILPKDQIQQAVWKQAYENSNVEVGLTTGLVECAQIGKGMWAKNRDMAGLLATKHNHPREGADTAWVPGPTAATLHAIHYHTVNVSQVQQGISGAIESGARLPAKRSDILSVPVMTPAYAEEFKANAEKMRHVDGATQSILGYVSPWVDKGVGCSSIPDKDDVPLMEDRATLRINSQLLANWLKHGIVSKEELLDSFARMAAKVDGQNAAVDGYTPMVGNFDGPAFQTSLDLVFQGEKAKNGYVEESLYKGRRQVKELGTSIGGDVPRYGQDTFVDAARSQSAVEEIQEVSCCGCRMS